ncbi:hypothetical protein [Rhodococcus sp. HNM0569]|uniref:hypothetical protein n=1 Tax=Rhodococcus sp. HNM0569 TaxID=2716340 RepID=UPI00146A598E|nr:hypothetical protein [Rhodococcus sp. HNM0569]NLU84056.1 hypothetical protein [Rhodococcus sp. HNM0569]
MTGTGHTDSHAADPSGNGAAGTPPAVDGDGIDAADVELDTDQVRKAQRVVALHSTDTDDCRMLLSMLGISDAAD